MAGVSLDDHQKFTLMKFRRTVSDITQPKHDDKFLLRWLRARSWDVEAAEKMLRDSMKWRQQWDVENIKNWEPPEALKLYLPSGGPGFDKDGAPIIVIPFSGLDIIGILHSITRQDFIRNVIQLLENYIELARQNNNHQVVVIFDMENFNLRQYAWRPAGEVIIAMIRMYEANYPEILKCCYIINAPRVFAIAFNVIKRFLNEYTLGKIVIFKNDPKKWKAAILQNIDLDSLPAHYGGNLRDPDGNPKYTTVVKQGGKVPKSLYKKSIEHDADDVMTKKYTSVVIKKGNKLNLDFIVADEGCFLKWEFRTDNHDIRFGVSMKDMDGTTSTVIKHKRVAAHQVEESGVISCQAPATYTITFDNSYSILRSKKLHYEILVTPPPDKIDLVTDVSATDEITATATPSC